MTHDQEREKFEAWATDRWLDVSREPRDKHAYAYVEVDYAWLAWQAAKREPVCSCPSGDGSLRWPCQAHPPSVSEDMLDAACEAYADMYDVEYGIDNRRQCIESALIAALTTPRGG